ncbi:MAG: hypothetical protein H6617_12360 [Bdellovibrionaceae bacterium]|nr:hypothetical protein [Pseudobdellovibrionaceae bacterium]
MNPRLVKLWGWGVALGLCVSAPAPENTVVHLPLLVGMTTREGKLTDAGFQEAHCKIVYRQGDTATIRLTSDGSSPTLGGSLLNGLALTGKRAENLLRWWKDGQTAPLRIRVPDSDSLEKQFDSKEWTTPNFRGEGAGYFVSPVVVFSAERDFEPTFFSKWKHFSITGKESFAILPLEEQEEGELRPFPGISLYDDPHMLRAGVSFDGEQVNAVTILHAEGDPELAPPTIYAVLTRELQRFADGKSSAVHILEIPTTLLRFPPGSPTLSQANSAHGAWMRHNLPHRSARQAVRQMWKAGDWIRMKIEGDNLPAFGIETTARALALQLRGLLQDRNSRPRLGRAKFSLFWPHFCGHLFSVGN